MREIKDGNRHTIDTRRWILECREGEVARCCDAEQYIRAAQRKSSSNLLGVFRSLWLEIAQGNSIRLNKKKCEQPPEFTQTWKTFMLAPARLERKKFNITKEGGDIL